MELIKKIGVFFKQYQPYTKDNRFLFWAIFSGIALIMPLASFDFGITCDENVYNIHGRHMLEFFQGKNDLAQRSPFDENGSLISVTSDGESESLRGLNGQGEFFELLANTAYQYFSPFGEYETRHFLNALFGVLAILCIGLVTKELAGWRAAWFALLFAVLSPRLFGHSMNNPKDLPFAAMYIFCVYQSILFVKHLPEIKLKNIIALTIGIAIACDIRISGLLIIPYLFLFTFVYWAYQAYLKKVSKNDLIPALTSFGAIVGISLSGYLAMSILWPYAQTDPINIPLKMLTGLSNYTQFDSYGLFEGRWLHNWEIPWYYIPKWLWITAPLFTIIGFFAIPLVYIKESIANYKLDRVLYSLLVFSFAFPILYVIYKKSNVYDDGRHLLFVYPSLVAVTAIAWDNLFGLIKEYYAKLFILAVFVGVMLEPARFIIQNHPQQAFYFNPLIGGIKGAFKKYEIDYWGNSVRAAVQWVKDNKVPARPNEPIRIANWYGSDLSSAYYLQNDSRYVPVLENGDWDYAILLPAAAKFYPGMLDNWPPPNSVHSVMVDGVAICVVIANPFTQNDGHILQKPVE